MLDFARAGASALAAAMLAAIVASGCGARSGGDPISARQRGRHERAASALKPLHRDKAPNSWMLGPGSDEKGQTFDQYVDSDPVRPDDERNTLYIVLLGEFGGKSTKIVELCAEFMGIYFNMPVRFVDPIPLSAIPQSAQRVNPNYGMMQIHAGWVLDELLPPKIPSDAVALIAFTASDLYPEDSWNFVFGMASIIGRVGVWSLFRFGDPEKGKEAYTLCLRRTLQTGSHETGHMLGMHHCTMYECNMNGSNNLYESDACPLALCPECAPKIWWACKCDPVERYRKLEEFCRRHDLVKEADFYRESREKVAQALQD